MKPIVIIGAGIAGYTLAKTLRALDNKRQLILITKDKGDYYSKPMLSNALGKNILLDDLVLTSGYDMSIKHSLELRHDCTVKMIDSNFKVIYTTQGTIAYDQLVLACGAQPRKLPLFPFDTPYVFSINHLDDYKTFRSALSEKKHITILGSGLVGCEFANDLAQEGFQITIISMDHYPLQTFISKEIGLELKKKLSFLGVSWHLGTQISSIKSEMQKLHIHLNDGSVLSTEILLSAIGLEPNKELAKKSGINVNRGIIADSYLKTNFNNIYTLGDCAEINGSLCPFIAPIRQASNALAKTLLGQPTKVLFSNLIISLKTPIYPITFNLTVNSGEAMSQ